MAASSEFTLISSDNRRFAVPTAAAAVSTVIKDKLSNKKKPAKEISLREYDGSTIELVANYLRHHVDPANDEEQKRIFDREFLSGKAPTTDALLDTAMAALDLGIQGLEDLVAERIAARIKDKSAERVRDALGIQNDLTEEEVAVIKAQYPSAFEIDEPDA